ncbi:MAG: antibiotic biosynthesis monooxygenase [Spirochaetales bacterium]|nr:antibiotic biosynthesis monooxygenase [Spirochaetales bacterium]
MIYLCVNMTIKEGKMEEFQEACRKVRPQVLAEEGCLMYDHTRDLSLDFIPGEPFGDRVITLYEKWESREALDAHLKTAHMKEFSASVADLREKVTIRTGTEAY